GMSLGPTAARPQVAAAPPARPGRRRRRSGGLPGRGGHRLEPQDRPGLDAAGSAETGADPGPEPEALSGRGLGCAQWPTDLGRGAAQDQPAVPATAQAPGESHLSECPADSCDPGQLWHPRQPPSAFGTGDGDGAAVEAPLPAPVLS